MKSDLIKNNYKDLNIDIDKETVNYRPYLYEKYYKIIVNDIINKFGIKNIQSVPYVEKIYISSAISYKLHSLDLLYKIYNSLYLITGQKPIYTTSSKSVSQFKIYKGSYIGTKVCLTNKNLINEFLERLGHIYLPSIKNFNGIRESNLSNNVLNIGIKDVHIIPEINKYIGLANFGITITICVKADKKLKNKREIILYLLNSLDIPVYD